MGNRWRSDDGAGLEVAALLRGRLPDGVEVIERGGEPIDLIEAWQGADGIWMADAVASGSQAGAVLRLDLHDGDLPSGLFRASTHTFGPAEAIELARSLGRLPPRVVLFGVEGACFDPGDTLTPAVRAGAAMAADLIREEVAAWHVG